MSWLDRFTKKSPSPDSSKNQHVQEQVQKYRDSHLVEGLEEKINSREAMVSEGGDNASVNQTINKTVSEKSVSDEYVPHEWIDNDINYKRKEKIKQPMSLLTKLLIGATVVFLIALTIAIYIWTNDSNAIEKDKIITEVTNPTEIISGQLGEIDILVQNLNEVPLTNATLIARFGDNVFSETGQTTDRIDVGFVAAGQNKRIRLPFISIGVVGDEREVQYELEYSPVDSANKLAIEFNNSLVIDRSPLSVRSQFPFEITIGETQSFSLQLATTDNISLDVLDVLIELPIGVRIDIPEFGNTSQEAGEYRFSTRTPTPSDPVTINGSIVVDDSSKVLARLDVMVSDENLPLASDEAEIEIVTPPVLITANNDTGLVLNREHGFRFKVTNTTDSVIRNLVIDADISNNLNQVNVSSGRYNSVQNRITYSPETQSRFNELDPGDSVDLSFRATPISGSQVIFDVKAVGIVPNTGGIRRELAVQTIDYDIKSPLSIQAFATYRRSNSVNTGPLPPQAGFATTYTINLISNVQDSRIKPIAIEARLPNNVTAQNGFGGDITVNNKLIRWSEPGNNESRTFQISLVPDEGQVGTRANLLENIRFIFESDGVTEFISLPNIDTGLLLDSAYDPTEAIVIN